MFHPTKMTPLQKVTFLVLPIIIFCFACAHERRNEINKPPLSTISSHKTTTSELNNALRELARSKTTNETPQFWTAIANNPTYNVDHRRRAVLQLFGRHFRPGMTLGEIGRMLDHPTWFVKEDIHVVSALAGQTPWKDYDFSTETVIWINILPQPTNHKSESPSIWFLISGNVFHLDPNFDKSDYLMGRIPDSELKKYPVKEISSSERWKDGYLRDQFGVPPINQ